MLGCHLVYNYFLQSIHCQLIIIFQQHLLNYIFIYAVVLLYFILISPDFSQYLKYVVFNKWIVKLCKLFVLMITFERVWGFSQVVKNEESLRELVPKQTNTVLSDVSVFFFQCPSWPLLNFLNVLFCSFFLESSMCTYAFHTHPSDLSSSRKTFWIQQAGLVKSKIHIICSHVLFFINLYEYMIISSPF